MSRCRFLIAIAALVSACTTNSSGVAAHQQECALAPGDTVYVKAGPVYRDCAVEQRAVLVDRSAHPDFDLSSPPPGGKACYVAEIEFVVNEEGIPEIETATILRATTPDFGQAALRAMSRWRYRPALLFGSPVRQIVRAEQKVSVALVAVPAGQMPPSIRAPLC